jgi:uncharacterized BrkB/YihY/UPF0761 family membrane protein
MVELFNMTQNSFFEHLSEKLKMAKGRLFAVIACYAVLLAIALYALLPARSSHERFLVGTVIAVFVLLFIKTMKHAHDDDAE